MPTGTNPTRFAFYGRTAAAERLGAQTARAWQLAHAALLIECVGGTVIAEYFDTASPRLVPWTRRPQASNLLARLPEPDRGFEAVVCAPDSLPPGGHHATASCFHRHAVALWLPELAGPFDPASPAHALLLEITAGPTSPRRPAH
jgi:hypothetical protein